MTQREIKFRAWDTRDNTMNGPWDIWEMTECKGDISSYNEANVFMQFTGLKDKNGVDIYEGDILKAPFCTMAPIEWIDSGFWVKQANGANLLPNLKETEIIGNIYENAELLTKGREDSQ